jgi:hypothetical protein
MKMRNVRELDLDLLDVAVARACIAAGDVDLKISDAGRATIFDAESGTWCHFRPSVNWAHAGPIIERDWPTIVCKLREWLGERWEASEAFEGDGRQLLCWFMRASVASRLGDEVRLDASQPQGRRSA